MRSVLLAFVFLGSCAHHTPQASHPVVLTSPEQLTGHFGKRVIIRGIVSNTRIPAIIGVDVESESPDLRGQLGEATGVLQSWVVTQEEIDEEVAASGQFAHRGAGRFFRLVEAGRLAQVRNVPKP